MTKRCRQQKVTIYSEACVELEEYGPFRFIVFGSSDAVDEHLALVKGEVAAKEHLLVRVASECLPGMVFGALSCDCRAQLEFSLKVIAEVGCGVVVFLRQEGRGHG